MIIVLEHYYDEEITNHISWCYQRFLKEFIYHFSIEDSAVIEGFPDNYNGYIERFEYAIHALYSKSETGIAEDLFELQRDMQIPLPKDVDIQKVMERIPTTTDSVLSSGENYKDYTFDELSKLMND